MQAEPPGRTARQDVPPLEAEAMSPQELGWRDDLGLLDKLKAANLMSL